MIELPDDFRDLLVEFADASADFVVVGGHAVAFHGHPRATKDLDVLVRPSIDNASRVYRALAAFGAPLQSFEIKEEDFSSYEGVLQIGLPPRRIDVLNRVAGITFELAVQAGDAFEVDGRRIPIIGLEYASSYDGEINLSALGDGDVVMLRSYPQGFVGCNASGEVQTSHSPTVIDGYVWMVHRTDIDGDGTDELQLELIDGSGETGTYLKMNGSDELSCEAITGIGDAAGWNFEQSVSTGGTYYRTVLRMLSNHEHGQCLSFSDSGGSGASCVSYKDRLFSFEILAHAS